MKAFTAITLLLVALAVADVFSQEHDAEAEVAHHRSKRSPDGGLLPLILGKSFLLGAVLGPKLFHKGWGHGGGHRHGGWGWAPRHSHGGWGGWSSAPTVTVHHGWGWH